MMRALAIIAVLAPTIAAADPVTFTVGLGVRRHLNEVDVNAEYVTSEDDHAAAFDVAVAMPIRPKLALGLRAGVATPREFSTRDFAGVGGMLSWSSEFSEMPIDGAVVVRYDMGRVWLAPWLGVHTARRHEARRSCESHTVNGMLESTCHDSTEVDWSTNAVIGLDVGVDIVRFGPNHIGVALGGQHSTNYSSIGLDVFFRR